MNARAARIQEAIAILSGVSVDELAGANDAQPSPWLSVDGYARHRRVSRETVYRLMREGLPFDRVGRRLRRIHVATADRWIAERPPPAPPASLDEATVPVR